MTLPLAKLIFTPICLLFGDLYFCLISIGEKMTFKKKTYSLIQSLIFVSILLPSAASDKSTEDHVTITEESVHKKVCLELKTEGNADFIADAIRLCDNLYNETGDVLEKYKPLRTSRDTSAKQDLLSPYYPLCDTSEQLRSAAFFLEADCLAWGIISRSLKHYKEHHTDLLPLFYECTRLYTTTCNDLSTAFQKKGCPPYLLKRQKYSTSILACLMCEMDFQSSTPIWLQGNELLKYLCDMGDTVGNYWYYNVYLANCFVEGDDETRSFLDLDEESFARLKKSPAKKFDGKLADELKKPQLFKILDSTQRNKKYLFKLPLLVNYHIYLGDIDTYLSTPPASSTKHTPPVSPKQSSKKDKKEDKTSKGSKSLDKERSSTRKEDTSSSASSKKSESDLQSHNPAGVKSTREIEKTIEESQDDSGLEDHVLLTDSITSYKMDATTPPTFLEEERNSCDWEVVTKKTITEKSRVSLQRLTINEILELCQRNSLTYKHYAPVRNILICHNPLESYLFNGARQPVSGLFQKLQESVTQENAQRYIRYFLEKRENAHIRMPNLARFFITFHLSKGTKQVQHTFVDDETYMSGAQVFKNPNDEFKAEHRIKLGYDLLTSEEKDGYWRTEAVRQLYLKMALLNKIQARIVDGSWIFNALDTEALIYLDLQQHKLLKYLKPLSTSYPGYEIQGLVLGVSSIYESCLRCRNLGQGFQWRLEGHLRNLISKSLVVTSDPLIVSQNFKSMILFDGHVPAVCNTTHTHGESCLKTLVGSPSIDTPNIDISHKHQFIFSQGLSK